MSQANEQESLFPTLKPEVTDALDALIERRAALGKEGQKDDQKDGQKDVRVERLSALLDLLPVENPSDDLLERTLARIEKEKLREKLRVVEVDPPASNGMRIGFRMNELGVIAAMLLVSISLVWPMLDKFREDARRLTCANNLNLTGAAVASYASDFRNVLPNRGAAAGDIWWNTGKADQVQPVPVSDRNVPLESNSSQLFAIVRNDYINPDNLNCPNNQTAVKSLSPTLNDWPTGQALSYSYQNQYIGHPMKLDHYKPAAIIADKNPLFVPRKNQAFGLEFSGATETTNSRLHKGEGQNVLLRDMSVLWTKCLIWRMVMVFIPFAGFMITAATRLRRRMKMRF